MSTEKKTEDQITEAGAVELDETQLDEASGGIIAVAPSPEYKFTTEYKFDLGTPSPEQKVRGG